jgi:hypothetical protein
VQHFLENQPGRQLVIVKYDAGHDMFNEWVYNAAAIDASQVVWARDMGAAGNRELLDYYKDRKVWLAEPDQVPPKVSPYPGSPDAARERDAKGLARYAETPTAARSIRGSKAFQGAVLNSAQ